MSIGSGTTARICIINVDMSVDSVLTERYALWRQILCDDFGYEETSPGRLPGSIFELALRAVRPAFPPVQPVVVEIHETWLAGDDPELGLVMYGCFLAVASWHAQVVPSAGDIGAERLDVDRRKPVKLRVHIHPLGSQNDVRLPAAPLRHPEAWVQRIEETIAAHYGY
jgi:hypothetical protein